MAMVYDHLQFCYSFVFGQQLRVLLDLLLKTFTPFHRGMIESFIWKRLLSFFTECIHFPAVKFVNCDVIVMARSIKNFVEKILWSASGDLGRASWEVMVV